MEKLEETKNKGSSPQVVLDHLRSVCIEKIGVQKMRIFLYGKGDLTKPF